MNRTSLPASSPASSPANSPSRGEGPKGARITARGLLASEWTKLWSVRSLWITLAAGFALVLGLGGYLVLDGQMLSAEEAEGIPFGWTAIYPVGMLVLVVFGILSVTGEYAHGAIRTSMVAAPRRTGVLLAKAAVVGWVTAALAALTSVALYALVQVAGTVPLAQGMSLFDPDMFWGVLGGTLILPYGALLGLFLGGLVRNAAAAVCLYFGLFQMGPQILPALLPEGATGFLDYFPLAALDVLRSGGLNTEPYGTGVALLVAAGWLVAGLGAVAWLLRSRDV